jgi:2-hydroxy-3-keto-5-methylthiopentenyl-1-phosphate phosphatase
MNITILSAGFDFYITRILDRFEIDSIELLATPTKIIDLKLYPEFIRYDKSVCIRCVDCKGARIRELSSPDETSIFIGDGHSDSHGAREADIVYAKSFLAEYLENNSIKYFPFSDFFDIIKSFQRELDLN